MAITAAQRSRLFGPPGQCPKVNVATPWGIVAQAHPHVAGLFLDACREAVRVSPWRPRRIDSYAFRAIRGSYVPSLHGWAMAWDFFATPPTVPPPGGVWTPYNGVPASFAAPFQRRGFTWGAGWRRADVPHIEWNGPPPGGPTTYQPLPPTAATTRGVFMALSDSQQGELYNLVRNDHAALQALRIEVDGLRANVHTLQAKVDALNVTGYQLRDSLSALIRRLFGVDEKLKNDHEPFWRK